MLKRVLTNVLRQSWIGAFLPAVLIIGLALHFSHAATGQVPNLTSAQQKNWMGNGDYLLVDFFSPMCNTCLMIEPYLSALQKELGSSFRFKRIDLSKQNDRTDIEPFQVKGTPTYILFDRQGKPVYRMHNYISLPVLVTQLKRYTGQLSTNALPKDNPDIAKALEKQSYVLLAIHPENCSVCTETEPYLNAIRFAYENGATEGQTLPAPLAVVVLHPDDKTLQPFLKANKLSPSPTYLLFDPQTHELFRHEGPINPQALWKNIRLLTDNGL